MSINRSAVARSLRRSARSLWLYQQSGQLVQKSPDAILAAVVLSERAAAWDALTNHDLIMAREHLVEARWFLRHVPEEDRKLVRDILKEKK